MPSSRRTSDLHVPGFVPVLRLSFQATRAPENNDARLLRHQPDAPAHWRTTIQTTAPGLPPRAPRQSDVSDSDSDIPADEVAGDVIDIHLVGTADKQISHGPVPQVEAQGMRPAEVPQFTPEQMALVTNASAKHNSFAVPLAPRQAHTLQQVCPCRKALYDLSSLMLCNTC